MPEEGRMKIKSGWLAGMAGLLFAAAMAADRAPATGFRPVVADEDGSRGPGSIIKRYVDPLVQPQTGKIRSPMTSDEEHATSAGPVLTLGRPVFIHTVRSMATRRDEKNFILESGRIFMNYEEPFESEKAPQLMIRSIDGGRNIPFVIRTLLYPRPANAEEGSVEISFRLPLIFQPRMSVEFASLNNRKVSYRLSAAQGSDTFVVSIPVSKRDLESARSRPAQEGEAPTAPEPVQVFVGGVITLQDYEPDPPGKFAPISSLPPDNQYIGISRLIAGRDFGSEDEKKEMTGLSASVTADASNVFDGVKRLNRYSAANVRYFRNSMKRTAAQILREGFGDCDDYTRVLTTLLRAQGIPCKAAVGYLYDFNHFGAHAWVEAALPLKSGGVQWFLCDPTLASAAEDPDYFVQFKNRIHLYTVTINVRTLNLPVDEVNDILLNWYEKGKPQPVAPQAFPTIFNAFRSDLARSLQESVSAIRSANQELRREFLFDPGSKYILLDRPAPQKLPPITDIRNPDLVIRFQNAGQDATARFQIKLDSTEDLIYELGVIDEDFYLESSGEGRVIAYIEGLFRSLKQSFFQGADSTHNLEMTYTRDRHTDRLQKVSLRVGRYLVEQDFGKIVELSRNQGLLSSDEVLRLEQFNQICHGRNFYFLQELARFKSLPNGGQFP
jgi:transglutaminase-like putative cysteine protease